MLEATCQILYLGSPVLLAGLIHGFFMKFDWLPRLKKPLDLGMTLRGKRVFGDHKTLRGLLVHLGACVAGAMIQVRLQTEGVVPPWLLLVDYGRNGMGIGVVLGLGMTVGELPNSFLKRRFRIRPGGKKKGPLGVLFFLLDQVDLAVGIWIILLFFYRPPLFLILWSFVLTLTLHVAVSTIGYVLGMRKTLV